MITRIEHSNLGTVNKNLVTLYTDKEDRLEIYYSYNTPVHYYFYNSNYNGITKEERQTRVNDWSTTTGKFLNELQPDKSKRVSGNLFMGYLEMAIARLS